MTNEKRYRVESTDSFEDGDSIAPHEFTERVGTLEEAHRLASEPSTQFLRADIYDDARPRNAPPIETWEGGDRTK